MLLKFIVNNNGLASILRLFNFLLKLSLKDYRVEFLEPEPLVFSVNY